MPDSGGHMGGTRPGRRVTQREAAEVLGVSVEAIRKRVKRGTLRSEKGEDGRRYVCLDAAQDAAQHHADHAGHAYPQPEGRQHADQASLVEELRDQVGYLREQLRREQDAHAEARRIIAALTARIPEVEAPAQGTPAETPEAPSEAREQPGRESPRRRLKGLRSAEDRLGCTCRRPGGPLPRDQQRTSERPWWRRMFGG